jgi:hypothetical protein
MNCQQHQAEYIADAFNNAFDRHRATCSTCRRAVPFLDATRSSLADPVLWELPPADGADRLLASISSTIPANVPPRGRRRWVVPAYAAATVVLLAVAATTLAVLRPTDDADWHVALAAQTAFPDAVANVEGWNTDTGTRMRITINGIDNVADEGFYEVWMTSPDGQHIAAGTFRSSGTIDTWSAVRRADFPRLWITLESFDGDPSPSGRTVLDTTT